MDKAQLHILQHTLGLDEYGQGRQYRNHYVAGPGHHSYSDLLELVALGYMAEHPATAISGGDPWFSVTRAGTEAVVLFSPAPPPEPKLTRAQKRYRDYWHGEYADDFAWFLGINVPRVDVEGEYRKGDRGRWRYFYRYRYSRTTRHYWGNEVIAGEWKPTKKEAKASYKAALLRRRQQDNQATLAVA